MSLKAFHVFFICISIALAGYFGVWALGEYRQSEQILFLVTAGGSFLSALGLGWYLVWMMRKLKNYGYLSLLVGLVLFHLPSIVQACPVCLGNPNSQMSKAANGGVLFLLGVITTVLASFASLFIFWLRRDGLSDPAAPKL